MVSRNVYNRWIRRYRLFFVIGIVILSFQVYLALRFFTINTEKNNTSNAWNPYKLKSDDLENSVNSARKIKDSLVIDDEDVQQISSKRTLSNPKQKLNLDELDFIPACDIVTKEAISAIHRAKTQKCKQEISNITCLIQKGLLYPEELPNYCLSEGYESGKSLGCFKDEKNFRILNGYYGNSKNNSPKYCMRLCLQSGFPFAGVQYSTECFCGNEEPSVTAKLPDSSCNMKCPSDPHLICGGYFTTNIYQTGIKKFYPQVAATSSTSTNKPVKIVYLLTLNGRALRQVKRLIKILYNKDHYFYIHVDVRQDYLFRELLSLEKQFPNIRLTRRRFSTIWGGASLLNMLLSCMKELLSMDWKWDFVLNLSESDYPVKTTNRLVDFLSMNRGKNFVKSHGREVQRFIQKQGLDKTFVECDTHMWRTGDRKLPWGLQIDGGSDWVALSHNFVQYVATDYPDQLIEGLLVIFKYTLLPAESFFHTVLRNSKFCNTYVDNNLHVTNWKRKLGCKCQYKHVVDWCGCSPNDFKPEDWLRIQNTEARQLYFARKFEPVINQAVILQLEQWLFGVDFGKNITNINSYWQSVFNHLDLGFNNDDSLFTISHSLIRHKLKSLRNCPIPHKSSILEINSYHLNDINEKILVLFKISHKNATFILETSFKSKNMFLLKKSNQFSLRFKSLVVSTDYDQKEQISRNFPRTLGPFSEPVLIYSVSNSDVVKSTNVSFLWIDPSGRLVELSEASIDENYNTFHIKPNLKQPLLPGEWIVKLIYKNETLAETSFLITPLTYLSGNNIAQNQVIFLHAGTDVFKEFDQTWDKFLSPSDKKGALESLSKSNAKRFGPDLEEWVDNLFLKFYKIGSLCVVDSSNFCNPNIPKCKSTSWSSLAPDPKSFIGKLNETTGGFNLW